jgi:hypothetical protein
LAAENLKLQIDWPAGRFPFPFLVESAKNQQQKEKGKPADPK